MSAGRWVRRILVPAGQATSAVRLTPMCRPYPPPGRGAISATAKQPGTSTIVTVAGTVMRQYACARRRPTTTLGAPVRLMPFQSGVAMSAIADGAPANERARARVRTRAHRVILGSQPRAVGSTLTAWPSERRASSDVECMTPARNYGRRVAVRARTGSEQAAQAVQRRRSEGDLERDAGGAGGHSHHDDREVLEQDTQREEHDAERRQRVEAGERRCEERAEGAGERQRPEDDVAQPVIEKEPQPGARDSLREPGGPRSPRAAEWPQAAGGGPGALRPCPFRAATSGAGATPRSGRRAARAR